MGPLTAHGAPAHETEVQWFLQASKQEQGACAQDSNFLNTFRGRVLKATPGMKVAAYGLSSDGVGEFVVRESSFGNLNPQPERRRG